MSKFVYLAVAIVANLFGLSCIWWIRDGIKDMPGRVVVMWLAFSIVAFIIGFHSIGEFANLDAH